MRRSGRWQAAGLAQVWVGLGLPQWLGWRLEGETAAAPAPAALPIGLGRRYSWGPRPFSKLVNRPSCPPEPTLPISGLVMGRPRPREGQSPAQGHTVTEIG